MGTVGVLMALEACHSTGRGQRVATSLQEGQMSMLSHHLCRYSSADLVPGPGGSGSAVSVPYQALKAADDWIVIAAFNARMRTGFCGAVGQPDREHDPRFATADARAKHRDVLLRLIDETLAVQPAAHWIAGLDAAGVPCTRVNNRIDQSVAEEQVAARDMVVEMDVPGLGRIQVAGLQIKLSETPGRLDRPPPHLGEHTAEVLSSLGCDADRVAKLAAGGAEGLHGARQSEPTAA